MCICNPSMIRVWIFHSNRHCSSWNSNMYSKMSFEFKFLGKHKGIGNRIFLTLSPIVHLRRLKVPDDVALFVENLFSTYFDKCSLYQLEPVIWSDRQSDVTCQTKICENSRSAPPFHPPLLFSLSQSYTHTHAHTHTHIHTPSHQPLLFSPSQSRTQQNPADNKGLRNPHAMHWPEIQNWFLPHLDGLDCPETFALMRLCGNSRKAK